MAVTELDESNFEAEVLESKKPVLVDFWASWCAPCRMLSPLIEELSQTHSEYKFCKVNVDDQEKLAYRFNVMSIPLLVIFKNGKVTNQSVGAIPKEQILELFN